MESLSEAALIFIPTPIGNLDDLSPRVLNALNEVDLLLAEDTRHTGQLLKRLGISVKLMAFHAHNEHRALDHVIQLLQSGQKVGMVSDAGTPGISDPAFLLSRACRSEGIAVSCLPGPSAFVPALVMSGLPCHSFYFEGFLPHKKGRMTRWLFLQSLPCTLVLYESPHRIRKTLNEAADYLGPNRQASLVREISKMHEEVIHGSLEELEKALEEQPRKGEMVLVIGPKEEASKKTETGSKEPF